MQITNTRHYGLDLFRILSMLFVVILHLLGHGGALSAPSSDINFAILRFLQSLAYPAVNCFVFLSGFVGYRNEKYFPKISNIINIVLSTLFYSIIFYVLYVIIRSEPINIKQLAYAVLPTLTKQYWFVSAYLAMFLLSPIINLFVHKAGKKMLFIVCIVTLIFALPSTRLNPFDLNHGYSVLWLTLLYMLGAILKKENLLSKISVSKSLLLIAIGILANWSLKLASRFLGFPFSLLEGVSSSYCSPATLLMAIGWMALCSHIKTTPCTNKVISFITPSVFSVYLIHDNPYVRQLCITNKFEFISLYNPIIASAIIFASAATIFIGCLLIDKFRILLFKICGVPKMILFFDKQAKCFINKMYQHFMS